MSFPTQAEQKFGQCLNQRKKHTEKTEIIRVGREEEAEREEAPRRTLDRLGHFYAIFWS